MHCIQKLIAADSSKAKMEAYLDQYMPSDDSMQRVYLAEAKKRGNTVRFYKPQMTVEIGNALGEATGYGVFLNYHFGYRDADPALIEYSHKGKIVSMLVRSHQVSNIDNKHSMVVQIIYGRYTPNYLSGNLSEERFAELSLPGN